MFAHTMREVEMHPIEMLRDFEEGRESALAQYHQIEITDDAIRPGVVSIKVIGKASRMVGNIPLNLYQAQGNEVLSVSPHGVSLQRWKRKLPETVGRGTVCAPDYAAAAFTIKGMPDTAREQKPRNRDAHNGLSAVAEVFRPRHQPDITASSSPDNKPSVAPSWGCPEPNDEPTSPRRAALDSITGGLDRQRDV